MSKISEILMFVFIVGVVHLRFPTRERKDAIELPKELIKDILPEGDAHLQEERRLMYVALTRTKEKAFKLIDSLKLAKNLANLGDAKTLVIHPASTIFHDFSPAQCSSLGVCEDMVRVSVGIEDFEDIKNDFEQAIEKK